MKTKDALASRGFVASTARYESWLGEHLTLVPEDLVRKHKFMKEDLFSFFRATFYRWAELFPEVCPPCMEAREVLAVGDLHVENFGTWRDVEGRLVWGINDFDEVTQMPWTIDLVRLAASAHIAIDAEKLGILHKEACSAILEGYKDGLKAGGKPFVLAGRHAWLNDMVHPGLRTPADFWGRMNALATITAPMPKSARRGIDKTMPGDGLDYRVSHRVAGLGSLGRQRFVAIAEFQGGYACREAKALAPSAWDRLQSRGPLSLHYQSALDSSVRAIDPFVRVKNGWIVRRLAPDCARVELSLFPTERDEARLMHAMGWEVANVHLGSAGADELAAELRARKGPWLHQAATKMIAATRKDWEEWRSDGPAH